MTKILACLLAVSAAAGQDVPSRPKVLGVAHMAVFVQDLAKARHFYEDFLGFAEPFTLPAKDGTTRIAFVKVNDFQYLEIFTDATRGEGQLNHISFYTDDADRMLAYLKAKGAPIQGSAEKVPKGQTGNKNFNVKDPDGHLVEIVEYQPDSWTAREKGKFLPATRIADHILHVGVLCGDLDASLKFYGGVLGFGEFRRGDSSPGTLSWVDLRPAEGQDYLELMLYRQLPAPGARGGENHVSLTVPDAEKALAELKKRADRGLYSPPGGKPLQIQIEANGKRRINLYDPDGTRVELMEATTVDGK
ncbi:MAG TPA: VOC family protein [Candidatus Sulfopaludibacter sp.]|jgi:lactoylglutathione lyase|nr:VOC family protein [Candidatus Sulfopaludibacter sp.]